MKKINLVLSINIHENIHFLRKQINNIKQFVKTSYIIIINANNTMFKELNKYKFITSQKNIIVNPDYFDKKRYHGSILKGIYSNLKYICDNYEFNYFIVLSSRNLFYREINLNFENDLVNLKVNIKKNQYIKWPWWQVAILTKFYQHFKRNKLILSRSPHEGLLFDYNSALKIILFFKNNNSIKSNLFNFYICAEEFAIQTILINYNGYYDLGNGVWTNNNLEKLNKNKFLYKVERK